MLVLSDRLFPDVDDSVVGIARYQIYRSYIQTGDVLEWRSETALGYSIRVFTGKDVNHTGGVIRLNDFTNELSARVYSPEATPHGFVLSYLSRQLKSFKGKVYVLPLKSTLDSYRPKIAAEQISFIGIPYDYGGLFKNAAGHVSANMNKLFCSEAIGLSFVRAGLLPIGYKNGKALRPGEFEETGLFLQRIRIY